MSDINFRLANIAPFANTESAALFGKNGFTTTIGEIPLYCDGVSVVGDKVRFNVPSLDNAFDKNFNKHVLSVNDYNLSPRRLRGFDYVGFDINEKAPDAFVENFSGFNPRVTRYTANIRNFSANVGTGYLEIDDVGGISDKITQPPFYVTINQLVTKGNTANNSIYLTGNFRKVVRENNITGISSTAFNQPIGVVPKDRQFIKVFVDGIQDTTFQYQTGDNFVTVDLSQDRTPFADTDANKIRTEVDHYTVPSLEVGDNLAIAHGNVYAVANVSYDPADADYNAAMTANTVYRVTFRDGIRADIGGFTGINQTSDPIGTVSNVVGTSSTTDAGTLTFTYDETVYPGNFNLSNNGVYSLAGTTDFEEIYFGSEGDKLIRNLPSGLTLVRARNVNSAKRYSRYNTQSVFIENIPIPKVKNLQVDESLFIDVNRGVSIRVTVSFDKIEFRDVTDYEISYKLAGSTRTTLADDKNIITNLSAFNTVRVPNITTDTVGGQNRVSFTINNLDRGPRNNPNRIIVKVTALNGNLKGQPVQITKTIEGKRTPPLPPKNFQVGQLLDNVVFNWQLERDASGSLRDLDLERIEIRRISKIIDTSDAENVLAEYQGAVLLASVAAPSSTASLPVPAFTPSTYFAQTVDTSGNKSTIVGRAFNPVKPADLNTFKAYNEDNPDLSFVKDFRGQDITNDNEAEEDYHGNYPSQNTVTGGISVDYTSTVIDNANGFASGWSSVSDLTDLQASANATYVTSVRDIGEVVTGKVVLDYRGEPFSGRTWNSQFRVEVDSSTEVSNANNVLVDRNVSGVIGNPTANGIGRYLQLEAPHGVLDPGESSVIYDSIVNQTLTSSHGQGALDTTSALTAGQFSGAVYAIWNPGQFAGDVANANTFAMVAGIVNANAIAIGQAYHANAKPKRDTAGRVATDVGADHSMTNAFSNLTSGQSSYYLVDLSQWIDDTESTFAGIDPSIVTVNTQIRYAVTASAFANGNVRTDAFTANTSSVDGYLPLSYFDAEFRHFQIKLEIENRDPSSAKYNLDRLRYTVDLKDKTFIQNVSVGSENQTIDYTSAGFKAVPFVNGQVVDAPAGSYTIIMRSITKTSCTVSIYDDQGVAVTTEDIQFEARGI